MDVIDFAQQREERDRALALQARLERNRAAQGVGDGLCKDCRQAIEPDRLKANPTACRCIECQLVEDKRQTRYYQGVFRG